MSTKNNNSKKLKTFNVKKDAKRQAKKRKLQAFLNLVCKEEMPINKKSNSYDESYKTLKCELKKYQKKEAIEPSFYLTQEGLAARLNLTFNEEENFISPLFIEDIYHLLLRSLLGNLSPFRIRWAKLDIPQYVSKTVLIEIEGLLQEDILDLNSKLNQDSKIFPNVFGITSSNVRFAAELSTLHLASDFYRCAKKKFSSMFPMENILSVNVKPCEQKSVSKLHLLLSPIQLAMEHYPLPQTVFQQSKSNGYVFTKETYTPVTANSPMFGLDCEMCRVTSGKQEVTRVAIVNEHLETVYHTLVKPKEKIIDYLTKFSGITKEMLEGITTTLNDVHEDIRRILPSDAILCGQSLNCDLHALKMIHPYVIDTSVIFNEFGLRQKKTSLKQLIKIHFKEIIQNDKSGHNPIEDSIAAMKLVNLKLQKSLLYGDAVLLPDSYENIENTANPTFSDIVNLNSESQQNGFFALIAKLSSKKVCLIGNEKILNDYHFDSSYDNVIKIEKSGVKEVTKTISDSLENSDLIISHLKFDAKNDSITNISDELKQAYESFPHRTLFLVILSDFKAPTQDYFKNSCGMAVLKKVKAKL